MTHKISKIADFIIKVIIIFTTLISLVFFARYYSNNAFIFSLIAFIFVLAITTKGLFDIFSDE